MTRLPDVPAGTRLLPDARLYQVWKMDPPLTLEASFSALESAVEHIAWMLRHDPMQRLTLDILPPVEVQAPCPDCGEAVMISIEEARSILAGRRAIYHIPGGHGTCPLRQRETTL